MSTFGQCTGCGTPFGVFKKEHGCKNCRFSFCSKCIPKKVAIPRLNNEKHTVCIRCYDILTKRVPLSDYDTKPPPPPDIYYKRVAELDTGTSQGPTQSKLKSVTTKYENMAKPDQDLSIRLDRLNAADKSRQAVPTLSELDHRLQQLKDVEAGTSQASNAASSSYVYRPPDRRTETEQSHDLMNQINEEVQIDERNTRSTTELSDRLKVLGQDTTDPLNMNNLNKADSGTQKTFHKNISAHAGEVAGGENLDDINRVMADMARELDEDARAAIAGLQKDKDIREKLDELKKQNDLGRQDGKNGGDKDSDEENDDDAADTIIKKLMEEAKLDEAMEEAGFNIPPRKDNQEEQPADPDELPWCCMCNEDADVRCAECDMDLFCHKCFKKCHKSSEQKTHKATKYTRPKSLEGV